jgi:hypothetical protein
MESDMVQASVLFAFCNQPDYDEGKSTVVCIRRTRVCETFDSDGMLFFSQRTLPLRSLDAAYEAILFINKASLFSERCQRVLCYKIQKQKHESQLETLKV